MQFQSEQVDGVLIVAMPNIDIDAGNADEFKKSICPLVEGYHRVVIDLGGIGFMDSAGLGAILSVFKKVRAEGGRFLVYGLRPEVQSLFDLVRMQRLFEVHQDRESAIQAAKS